MLFKSQEIYDLQRQLAELTTLVNKFVAASNDIDENNLKLFSMSREQIKNLQDRVDELEEQVEKLR